MSQELAKKAKQLDAKLKSCWANIKRSRREFGEILLQMKREELHRYIAKPGSRKGYVSFSEYVENRTDGEISKSTTYIAMGVASLTEGANALPAEVVDAMPTGNAYELSKVPAEKRTPALVKKAKEQPNIKFKQTAQNVRNESLPESKQKLVFVDLYFKVLPKTYEIVNSAIEDFSRLKGVVRDGNVDTPLTDKALQAICWAARARCKEELEAAEKEEYRATSDIVEEKEAVSEEPKADQEDSLETDGISLFDAPDAAQAIAAATSENRVVPIKGRAIQ